VKGPYQKICVSCGREFLARIKTQIKCGSSCSYYRRKSAKTVSCVGCGKEFASGRSDRKTCGNHECALYRRRARYPHVTGVSWEQYQEMLRRQDGRCAICLRNESVIDPRSKAIKSLCIDHDHVSSLVRGLLCMRCNRAVGLLRDDPNTAMAMSFYLDRSAKEKIEEHW